MPSLMTSIQETFVSLGRSSGWRHRVGTTLSASEKQRSTDTIHFGSRKQVPKVYHPPTVQASISIQAKGRQAQVLEVSTCHVEGSKVALHHHHRYYHHRHHHHHHHHQM